MLVGRAIAGTACGLGASVVGGSAVSLDFRDLLRSNKRIRRRIIAIRARPPRTPPTITPILVLELEVVSLEAEGELEDEELDVDVANGVLAAAVPTGTMPAGSV
jgi:hypothetical protein